MDKKGLFLKMDCSSLNETFEANRKRNKMLNSSFNPKVDNYLGSFSRGGKIFSTSRLNNMQHNFNENYVPATSLKEPKKLYSVNEIDDEFVSTRYKKIAKLNNDSDGSDADRASHKITPRSQSGSNIKSNYLFADINTAIEKKSMHSFKKDESTLLNSTNISSSSSLANDLNADTFNTSPPQLETKISENLSLATRVANNKGEINLIMLIGLFLGLVISKALIFVLLYLNWLLEKILQVRNAVLGTTSMWQLLNLNDPRNIQMQYKLILLPFAFISSLIYGFLFILYAVVRFLLTSAPNSLIKFIQNMHG